MPKKIHGRQVRQHQVGFASARLFCLRKSECWKQEPRNGRHHAGCHSRVLSPQEAFRALLHGRGALLHSRHTHIRPDDLAREENSHQKRKHAHAQKKVDPVLCCHIVLPAMWFEAVGSAPEYTRGSAKP